MPVLCSDTEARCWWLPLPLPLALPLPLSRPKQPLLPPRLLRPVQSEPLLSPPRLPWLPLPVPPHPCSFQPRPL